MIIIHCKAYGAHPHTKHGGAHQAARGGEEGPRAAGAGAQGQGIEKREGERRALEEKKNAEEVQFLSARMCCLRRSSRRTSRRRRSEPPSRGGVLGEPPTATTPLAAAGVAVARLSSQHTIAASAQLTLWLAAVRGQAAARRARSSVGGAAQRERLAVSVLSWCVGRRRRC